MIPPGLSAILALALLVGCVIFGIAFDGEVRRIGVIVCLGTVIVLLPGLTRGKR